MSDLLQMSQTWRAATQINHSAKERAPRAALATIVSMRGSAYRRPGARLLWMEDGTSLGLISGGCLENDVRARCQEVVESGQSRLVTYDTTSAQDIVWGLGLGCRGVVQVLVEPLRADFDILDWLGENLSNGVCSVVATIFAVQDENSPLQVLAGQRLMLREAESGNANETEIEIARDEISICDASLGAQILADARRSQREERSFGARYRTEQGTVEAFIEFVAPPLPLTIFGTGADAQPLALLARQMGWNVSVIDTRESGPPADFPDAHRIVRAHPEALVASLAHANPPFALNSRGVAVVMTHNFLADWEILKFLLPSPVRYIGLLGPKRRANELLERLNQRTHSDAVATTPAQLERLHAPIGLDIGAETPEEIALSIVAEIKARLSRRTGGFLRERSGQIHETS